MVWLPDFLIRTSSALFDHVTISDKTRNPKIYTHACGLVTYPSLTEPIQSGFHVNIFTGEEVLHEGWSSYDNLFGVLMITVTEFLENFSIYLENSRKKWLFLFLNGSLRC
jgi:hypothetical protein